MNKSDIELLIKIEDTKINTLRSQIQEFELEKISLKEKISLMNERFKTSKPSLDAGPYLRFRAIENQRLIKHIHKIDQKIEIIKDEMIDYIRNLKNFELLKKGIEQQKLTQYAKNNEIEQEERCVSRKS